MDDTLICALDLGVEWAWGKQPAEQYPRELALEGAAGVAYRFAPNWYAGVEIHTRWEYPLFDFDNFEHRVFYAGPSIHYSQERWWATLTWNYAGLRERRGRTGGWKNIRRRNAAVISAQSWI